MNHLKELKSLFYTQIVHKCFLNSSILTIKIDNGEVIFIYLGHTLKKWGLNNVYKKNFLYITANNAFVYICSGCY